MTAHDWLRQLRLQVLRLAKTAISPAARRRQGGKRASSRRDKIRFAPAAPQALEPRSLMTADPTLDGPWAPSGIGSNVSIVNHTIAPDQRAGAPQSNAMSEVGSTGDSVGRPAAPSAANDGLASRPTAALTQPNPDFGRGSHVASMEHVSYGHPGNAGHVANAPPGVSSSTTTQPVHTAQHHGPLQPAVVVRVFSTMYVSGSASGGDMPAAGHVAQTLNPLGPPSPQPSPGGRGGTGASGFSPFDHSGWEFASGFASGGPP
ncbi:MAG TPA: hypothetical protein VF278_06625, partial [Pirellulales bacterium]